MKQSKWPDFLFTITVRFVCGIVIGGVVCFLFSWKGILRAFSHNHTLWPLIWLGICGLVGGVVAVFTVPRWQTPWYRRDSGALDLRAELAALSQDGAKLGSNVVEKSVTIKTVGEDGEQHEYSSMEEVPPEIRSEIEALEKEAAQEGGNELSITETSQTGNAITSKTIRRKNISVYKIIDESGVERTYHSLEEMPPELRASVVEAENNSEGSRNRIQ
jgi:membrane peptidoglycan carboxypeptidase